MDFGACTWSWVFGLWLMAFRFCCPAHEAGADGRTRRIALLAGLTKVVHDSELQGSLENKDPSPKTSWVCCLLFAVRCPLFAVCCLRLVLSSVSRHARVAQWIRAFASGAKGRRFDPCRGYHFPLQLWLFGYGNKHGHAGKGKADNPRS